LVASITRSLLQISAPSNELITDDISTTHGKQNARS